MSKKHSSWLRQILPSTWSQKPSQGLSGGKPIVATAHLFSQVSLAGLREIWNEYVEWRKNIMPTLPEEERLFVTSMNSEKVWVLEDDQAYTLLYPDDY